jgi:hypothetical protein
LNKNFGLEINRPFFIRSKLPFEKVVTKHGNSLRLETRKNNGNNEQHFIFDGTTKTIKSVADKGRSISIQGGGSSPGLFLEPTNARWFQMFRYKNNNLVNEQGKVMSINGNRDEENTAVNVGAKTNDLNQQWDVIYVDKYPADLKKGETDTGFNLDHMRPFYLISSLKSERYLDVVDYNNNRKYKLVIKTRNGMTSQQFQFDAQKKAIFSVRYNQWVWNLERDGHGQ